jgi:chromosome segregation ATPase
MSTAGKVLSGLVVLAAIGWLYLAAGISAVNRDYGKKIEKLEAEIAQAQQEVEDVLAQADLIRRDATTEQKSRNYEYAALRSRMSNLERVESESKETSERYKLQKDSTDKQEAAAKAQAVTRTKERDDINDQRQKAENELNQLKADVEGLFAELKSLRDQFSETMAKNKELLKTLSTRSGSDRVVRRAALSR